MPQLRAKDLIAIIMLVGAFGLLALGHDGYLQALILLIAVGYGIVSIKDKLKGG